jgi:hypothetical protein
MYLRSGGTTFTGRENGEMIDAGNLGFAALPWSQQVIDSGNEKGTRLDS